MAFAVTHRHTSSGGTTDAASRASGSFTPAANSLLVVFAHVEGDAAGGSTAPAWTISNTGGLTFTKRDESGHLGVAYHGTMVCWTAPVGGSPSSMTVTVDPYTGSTTGWICVSVFDVTGHNVAAPFVQSADENADSGMPTFGNISRTQTVTLAGAADTNNLLLAGFGCSSDAGAAPGTPTSFTSIGSATGPYESIRTSYRINTTQTTVASTATCYFITGVVVEIAAAGATQYDQALTATCTASATFAKRAAKNITASSAAAASFLKRAGKTITSSSSSTATFTKQARKPLTAACTATATLTPVKVILATLTAACTATASMIRTTAKALTATSTTTASAAKLVAKTVTAAATATASLASQFLSGAGTVYDQALTAAATATATMTRAAGKVVAASSTATASMTRSARKTLDVSATATASMLRRVSATLTASSTSTAAVVKMTAKRLTAAATGTASVVGGLVTVVIGTATHTFIGTARRAAVIASAVRARIRGTDQRSHIDRSDP